jgi:hypothetical protein
MRFSVTPSLFLADRSRPLKVPCAVEQLPLRRLQPDWPWRVFEVGADEFGTAGFAASTLQHGHPIAPALSRTWPSIVLIAQACVTVASNDFTDNAAGLEQGPRAIPKKPPAAQPLRRNETRSD